MHGNGLYGLAVNEIRIFAVATDSNQLVYWDREDECTDCSQGK